MPELNEFLDRLADEVTATTRAPGATDAIVRARRRRRGVVAAAVAALAVVAVGGGLAIGSPGGVDDRQAPVTSPSSGATAPSPSAPSPSGPSLASGLDPESPNFADEWREALRTALTLDPAWSLADGDPYFLVDCLTNWVPRAGGSGGSFGGVTPSGPPYVWHDGLYLDSPAQASAALDRLPEALAGCATSAWQTDPIGKSGALLASSADGVMWVVQSDATISRLHAPTSDGPPSSRVQEEVVDLLRLWETAN